MGIGAAPAIRGLFHPYLDDETPRYTQTSLPTPTYEHTYACFESHMASSSLVCDTRLVLLPLLSFLVPPPRSHTHTRTHGRPPPRVSRHTVASYRARTFARGRFVHVHNTRGRVRFPRQPASRCLRGEMPLISIFRRVEMDPPDFHYPPPPRYKCAPVVVRARTRVATVTQRPPFSEG